MNFRAARRRTLPAIPLALASCAVLALGACHREVAPAAPPAVVLALSVHADGDTGSNKAMSYPIEVAARYSNTMSFRVAGKLIERGARLGDTVKKGQGIARP